MNSFKNSVTFFLLQNTDFWEYPKATVSNQAEKEIHSCSFLEMICSIAFYYRPFNSLSPSVTEDKSKTVRYFKPWSALHLKVEPQLKIIGLRPTIVAIPRYVTKFSSARGTWILPNSKIGQNVVQGRKSHKAIKPLNNPNSKVFSPPRHTSAAQQLCRFICWASFPCLVYLCSFQISYP